MPQRAPLRLAAEPAAIGMRATMTVQDVAAVLACGTKTVRKMLDRKELDGHKLGRASRVYIDSVIAYQEGHPIAGRAPEPRCRETSAASRESLAVLRAYGLL